MAPTLRLTLRTSSMNCTFSPRSSAGLAALDQLHVERPLQAVVLLFDLAARHLGRHGRQMEDAAEIQAARLPVLDALARVQQVGAADQFVELADAQLRHDLARFFGDEEEVVDDVLGLAG